MLLNSFTTKNDLNYSVTVEASAVNSGSGGNIPAFDINGHCIITDPLTTAEIGACYFQYSVAIDGWWVYQINPNKLANQHIRKPQWLASNDLRGDQGIKDFALTTSGFGGALPSATESIKITVKQPPVPKS